MPRVNIFLHGLMAIYQKSDEVLAFLIDLPGVHTFRAGDWCAETTLQSGKYQLTGVKAGDGCAKFLPEDNLHLGSLPFPSELEQTAQSVISFPPPAEIRALRRIPMTGESDFAGDDKDKVVSCRNMSSVQLLIFDADDLSAVRLGDHDWRPPDLPGVASVNLHIFAEEETIGDRTPEHAVESFAKMLRELSGLDIQLRAPKDIPHFDAAIDELPENAHPLETDDLSSRQQRFALLGKNLREMGPALAKDPKDSEALQLLFASFHDNEAVATKMGACSQAIAGS